MVFTVRRQPFRLGFGPPKPASPPSHRGAMQKCRGAKLEVDSTCTLPKRVLGNTGMEVSVLGYGGSPLGAIFDEEFDEEEGVASVREALELGVNYFDTSPYYGDTKSERVLGRALAGVPRSEYYLSTKAGRYGENKFDFTPQRLESSVKESLERLGVDYFDLVICHDVEFVDLDQIVKEALPTMARLKKEGLIRNVGVSGLPMKIFHYVLDEAAPGSVDVILSYCHNTLFDGTLTESLPYLERKGIGVINGSPLSMGLLSPQGPPPWHPASAELKAACEEAASICKAAGVSLPSLALQHSVSAPGVSVTLSGMPTRQQVRENVSSILQYFGSTEGSSKESRCLSEVKAVLAPFQNITWPSGLPVNN